MKVRVREVPNTTGNGTTYLSYIVESRKWWQVLWQYEQSFSPNKQDDDAVKARATVYALALKNARITDV